MVSVLKTDCDFHSVAVRPSIGYWSHQSICMHITIRAHCSVTFVVFSVCE
jgi:hypothetical protein